MIRDVVGSLSRAAKIPAAAVALQLALAVPAAAQGTGIERLFPARPAGHLTDAAGVVDAASAGRIETLAAGLRKETGAEVAIVTLPTIGDYAPVDVAVAIGRAWGVGRSAEIGDTRRNAGLVMLLVPRNPDDRNSGHIFIAPGQGLEGIVTDLSAGRVRDRMLPQLRRREYGPAILTGTEALADLIRRGLGPDSATARPARRGLSRGVILLLVFVLIIVLMVVAGAAGGGRGGRGPGPGVRPRRRPSVYWGGPTIGGGWGGFGGGGGGFGGGGFGGFGGGGGFSGGGAGGRF